MVGTFDHVLNEIVFAETQSSPVRDIDSVDDFGVFSHGSSGLTLHSPGGFVEFILSHLFDEFGE